nr:glycosyltransferase family 4 protein [Bacteroidota bacterium]
LFYVVGGMVVESYYRELMKSVNDSSYSVKIIFTGSIQNTAAILKKIDIMLHTMPYESFGRVFLEAMAAKVPVIAYNSGGAKDIVKHGETGLLIESRDNEAMANAVMTLADDIDLRRQMGEAGRRRVENHFTIEKHCEAVDDVYQDLLNGNLITT